jgi:hypothetical protein
MQYWMRRRALEVNVHDAKANLARLTERVLGLWHD